LPANAVLNSAYLNVSAIALRVALASQQNWTTLRTIVLDDPILEMDSLTQSALIDGLEAILASNHSPWRNLQLVITTWSEDFAVMAAHKLAHMNADSAPDREEFLIYRLNPLADGSVVSERHAPRWKTQASAA
jgi:ABC-type nitrate/sulfonate/bicarbonate transport system ATPase subunit